MIRMKCEKKYLSQSTPQYHLPELPQLNTLRCPSEFNGASGAPVAGSPLHFDRQGTQGTTISCYGARDKDKSKRTKKIYLSQSTQGHRGMMIDEGERLKGYSLTEGTQYHLPATSRTFYGELPQLNTKPKAFNGAPIAGSTLRFNRRAGKGAKSPSTVCRSYGAGAKGFCCFFLIGVADQEKNHALRAAGIEVKAWRRASQPI